MQNHSRSASSVADMVMESWRPSLSPPATWRGHQRQSTTCDLERDRCSPSGPAAKVSRAKPMAVVAQ